MSPRSRQRIVSSGAAALPGGGCGSVHREGFSSPFPDHGVDEHPHPKPRALLTAQLLAPELPVVSWRSCPFFSWAVWLLLIRVFIVLSPPRCDKNIPLCFLKMFYSFAFRI